MVIPENADGSTTGLKSIIKKTKNVNVFNNIMARLVPIYSQIQAVLAELFQCYK
jgi:hypothetical protein